MTDLTIRLTNQIGDYEIFARLLADYQNTTVTGDNIQNDDTRMMENEFNERYAACLGDMVIGYGRIFHPVSAIKPLYNVFVTIDKDYRNQGYGTTFYKMLEERAHDCGATGLNSECRDNDPIGLAFAGEHGYQTRRHYFESELDLTTVDFEQWQPVVDEVKAQGIRFSSLAGEGNTEQAQRKLYELNAATVLDNPGFDSNMYKHSFENFQKKIVQAHWFRAEGQLLAIDGDRYVGLGAVGIKDGDTAYNAFTGIDRDYRGRKIAQALKVLGCKFALDNGTKRIVTDNDSQNQPMLVINDKMGYQRLPGFYHLRKEL